MNKKLILTCLFAVVVFLTGHSQTFKAFVKAGDKAMQKKDFYAAMVYYKNALEIDNESIDVTYRYAEVCRHFHSYDLAEEYYIQVLVSEQRDAFPLTNFWMGEVKKSKGEYAQALTYFKKYLDSGNANKEMATKAKAEMATCRWALDQIIHPVDADINRLNKRVNSAYSDFGALMRNDTLYYSSYKFQNRNDKYDPPRRQTKILTSIRGSKGRLMKRRFNDENLHTAHTTFSRNGKRIYFTLCEFKGAVEISCNIYYREMDARKRWKKDVVKLPTSVNMNGYTATHPAIGIDPTNAKEVLYFVSNRPKGKGKLDIWYTEVSGKKFSEPKNLEAINTPEDDLTPFYHEGTQSLFFSSDGYQGLGGYDIFQSKRTLQGWTTPHHIGYPLNSSYNDLYFTLDADSTVAFLASNRLGSMYLNKKNKTCCNDIYKANFKKEEEVIEEPPIDSLTIVIEEEVPPEEISPEPPEPTTLEEFLPLALYYDNDEPDKRTRATTTKKTYEESYVAYYARKNEFIKQYTSDLEGEEKIVSSDQLYDFFDGKVKKGYDHLFLFSQILLRRLNDGDKVEIFLKGFTSPRAKSDYNLHLSKRRISCVRNHFKTYAGGIFEDYLQSGQLIISEKPFGETTASQNISDDLNDQKNSVFSVEASVERRVEIVEIKSSEK